MECTTAKGDCHRSSVDDACPIDQVVRQKEDRKAREAKLVEEGLTPEEIKKARRRKKFTPENHKDDCGPDFGPLEEVALVSALAADGSPGPAITYSHINDNVCCSDSVVSSEDELERVLNNNFGLHYLVGSGGSGCHVDPPRCVQVPMKELNAYLLRPANVGSIGVVEVFGGEGGVGKFCARRRSRRGANVDLVTGFDLTKRSHQDEVVKYLEIRKPLVVIFGFPCTSFGHWSHHNQVVHPKTWRQSREIGERFVRFVARICKLQVSANRHFIMENQVGSVFLSLVCFRGLCDSGEVVSINVPQCALGLAVE